MSDTVRGRIDAAGSELSAAQIVTGVAVASAIGFTLLFLQEPLAHDAMHNFRHAAGITCH
ncbi:MAG: CbtB-domain containing protein [Natronomonas sp.]